MLPLPGPTGLDPIVSPYGVVADVRDWPGSIGPPETGYVTTSAGSAIPGEGVSVGWHVWCGSHRWGSPDLARYVATAEGAERYAAYSPLGDDHVRATARELEGECLEPWRYPRCSAREYADPRCPLTPFDPTAPIRWVSGLDLHTGDAVWVPATMVRLGLDKEPQDRFWNSISTGYAVHTDPVEATVRGLCEVIERDMIALTWLQRLPLPLVGPEHLSEHAASLVEWNARHFVDGYVFDATSDLGVPTAYCLLVSEHDRNAARVLGAASARDLGAAAEKALLEASTATLLTRQAQSTPPESVDDIDSLEGGLLYMGLASRAHAFDFLLDGVDERTMRTHGHLSAEPDAALAELGAVVDGAGMRAVVVDRTTTELAAVGLHAMCVVVPDLQPMSVVPAAQYKGHRRLYEGPASMGYPVSTEEELNPWPQPFA